MCGHIHTPADKMLGDVHYLNSGDWIESLTAIVEHWDGRYELVEYTAFVKEFPFPDESTSDDEPQADPAEAAPKAEGSPSASPMV
jgi:hypothetical protein